jgi:UDP-glucose 4-epimerase
MEGLSGLRCLVLGGGGFIGTNLCKALLPKVESLRGFGRRQAFPSALVGVDWFPGNFADSSALAAAVENCDIVFHLITTTTPFSSNVDKIADLESNVVSTLHLLDACREAQVKRVIFISSGGTVYGKHVPIPTSENAATDPIVSYGISKLVIEKYLELYRTLYGLDYQVLRVANPYGPYQTALKNQGVISAFLNKIMFNKTIEIWGDGSVIRDYIYIDDVVDALLLSASYHGKSRVLNIGSGVGHSLNDIVQTISVLMNKEISVKYVKARTSDVPASILNISLAQKELNWQPKTEFKEGLEKTIRWLAKEQGLMKNF